MSSELRDHLAALADEAPRTVEPGGHLWRHGTRRHRLRTGAAVLLSTVAATAVVGAANLVVGSTPSRPAQQPAVQLHLPRHLHAPEPWAPGTDEVGPPGPLAAVSMAPRNVVDGAFETRQEVVFFGVSAVDGSAVFLDLPGIGADADAWLSMYSTALSPDGTKVAVERHLSAAPGTPHWPLVGWDVYDTVSGKVTRLRVPGMREIRGRDAFAMRFSGDSRYLLTNYSPSGSDGSRDDALVAWDVRTGRRFVAEGTGHYWLPEPGSAPGGIAWSRDRRIFWFDPLTGDRRVVTLPREVVTSSFGPDGRALAYVGHRPSRPDEPVPWQLYGGASWQDAKRLDIGTRSAEIRGWRSDHEVVVVGGPGALVVDLESGSSVPVELSRDQDIVYEPAYAADLWRNPLVAGTRPPSAPDPRWWMRPVSWVSGALVGLVALVLVRRRQRARG